METTPKKKGYINKKHINNQKIPQKIGGVI